jgi:hypothetical protein
MWPDNDPRSHLRRSFLLHLASTDLRAFVAELRRESDQLRLRLHDIRDDLAYLDRPDSNDN